MEMEAELVPLSEAKARLFELVRDLSARDALLLRHGRPVGVLMAYERWADLAEEIEDLKDKLSLLESRDTPPDTRVPLDAVRAELGLAEAGDAGAQGGKRRAAAGKR